MAKIEKLVPDTSVIVRGVISDKIEKKEFLVKEIIIHEALLAELEHQANLGKAIGYIGLDEVEKLRKLVEVKFSGKRPRSSDIKFAYIGEVDALIRSLAWDEGATFITSDKVQSKVAKAKKGVPGKWDFVSLSKKILNHEELKDMSREIIEEAKSRPDGFLEIERAGSTIVQLEKFRIVITKPPFSDKWEITAVRPVKKLNLDDYKLSEKLFKRIGSQADGILIAGAPGAGKSCFTTALAEFYASQNKIVKTIEAPRDLQLGDEVTQYSLNY